MNLKEKIQNLADEIFPEILEIRRFIHQHPELSFQEYKTAEYICEVLGKENIAYRKGIAGTGILADIEGRGTAGSWHCVQIWMHCLYRKKIQ